MWGTVDSRGAAPTADSLLNPMDAESTSPQEFISERLPFEQENEGTCGFVSPSQLKDLFIIIMVMMIL